MRLVFLAVALFLPGCLGYPLLPYAAPSVSYVPPFDLECPAGEVRVFRVNITREQTDAEQNELCELKEVGPDRIKKTPGQTGVGWTSGAYVVVRDSKIHKVGSSYTIAVRLYRQGYETVELNSWDPPDKVVWKPALTVAVQEMALDDLFDLGAKKPASGEDAVTVHRSLEPGSKSAAHRSVLRFGATEYARLAGQVTGQDASQRELRDRLVDKARRLEKLADDSVKR